MCRKGTHCCRCLMSPHLCPEPWQQRAARGGQPSRELRFPLAGLGERGFPYPSMYVCIQDVSSSEIPKPLHQLFSTQKEIVMHWMWHTEIRLYQVFQPVSPGVRPQPRAGFHAVGTDPSASPFPHLINSNMKNLRQSELSQTLAKGLNLRI